MQLSRFFHILPEIRRLKELYRLDTEERTQSLRIAAQKKKTKNKEARKSNQEEAD